MVLFYGSKFLLVIIYLFSIFHQLLLLDSQINLHHKFPFMKAGTYHLTPLHPEIQHQLSRDLYRVKAVEIKAAT